MKNIQKSLIKAISISIISIIAITTLAYIFFPQYLFVIPGSEIYTTGIVDHKKMGLTFINSDIPTAIYTTSIRLFEDDPINNIKSGETIAYILPKDQWNMLEWGDSIKVRLLPELKAEISEVYPALKPPEWSTNYESVIKIDLTPDKFSYKAEETAFFNVTITNDQQNLTENSFPIEITVFESAVFWVFENGKMISSPPKGYTTKEITLEPNQEYSYTFQWTANQKIKDSTSIYYIRNYIGYFTRNPENTLSGTTIITVEN